MMLRMRTRNQQSGFTLIEMITVIAIIAILLGIAVPIYTTHLLRAREAVLRTDLASLRNAIDQFTQDKQRAPQSLEDVVAAGYLRALPKDPFTHAADWQAVQEETLASVDQTQPGISDVHSSSNQISSEGTAYSSW